MGDFSAGKVQTDVELINGAPALVVAKLETKAPELFAQLAATGGATDEEKLQQLPMSLAAFLRLHDGAHGGLGLGSSPCLILAVGFGARDVARGDLLLALHVASWLFSQAGLCRNLSAGCHLGCPSKREVGKRDAMCGSDALGADTPAQTER